MKRLKRKRAWVSNFWKFKSLTETILEWWYSNKSIVPVDNAFNILDWSHRLGILWALGQHPVVEVLTAPSHYYWRKWFETNWFTETELEIMDDLKRTFFRQYFEEPEHKQHLCFIWWSTIRDLWGSWEKVLKEIWEENLWNFYIRNFWSELENVIGLTYLNDGIGQSTLRAKTEWITQKSQWLLGIISLTWSEDPKVLKEKVRSRIYPLLSDYAFDSIIHVVDEVHPNGNKIRHSIDAVVKNMNALLYI